MEQGSTPKIRRRRRKLILVVGLFVLLLTTVALNLIAFMQARAMTTFVGGPLRTRQLESLTFAEKIQVLCCGMNLPRPVNRSNPADIGLQFQTIRFGETQNDDCEAWYIPAFPSRGLCIAFHGYGACKSSLLPVARAFHHYEYDVLLVDFHGSGGSRGNQTTLGYREAEDVAGAVYFAKKQWAPPVLILYGQSMGGAAILRAVAQLNVRPSGVIIESTFDRLLSTVENRFRVMGLPCFPLARLLVFWGGWQYGFNGFALNPAEYASSVHCPVLVFQGGCDSRVTTAQARRLFSKLAAPKQFELFEKSGHGGFLTDDFERWDKAVSRFLARLAPRLCLTDQEFSGI
jgi:uncharacterized protein